jgi:hypothetical protein
VERDQERKRDFMTPGSPQGLVGHAGALRGDCCRLSVWSLDRRTRRRGTGRSPATASRGPERSFSKSACVQVLVRARLSAGEKRVVVVEFLHS